MVLQSWSHFCAGLTPDSVCRFFTKETITAPDSFLSVEKLLIWTQSNPVAVTFEFKRCNQQFFVLKAWPAEVVVVEFSGEHWIALHKSLNCVLNTLITRLGHRANYDWQSVPHMRVDLVDTYVLLYSAPHDLKAHLRSFVLVHILVEKLELDSIFNIEEREHYS